MKQNAPRTRLMIAGRDAVGVCLGAWHCPNFNHKRKQRTRAGQEPKSSPKRIAAKKVRESPPPRLSFSARLLRIHALGVRKHRNLLIGRHLPTSAFYSAVFQNALAGAL